MKKLALIASSALIVSSLAISVDAKDKKAASSVEPMVQIQEHKERQPNDKEFDRYMRETGYNYRAHYRANRELRQRVRQLERAVRQMQRAVYRLEETASYDNDWRDRRTYSCMLETRMDGTFFGEGPTLISAKAAAKAACEKQTNSFWCREPLECDERS
ncbi:hypothetical protein [Pleionea litopenaei]|uniref:Uncharacterized protein n=1 Tax=Pleionea litopenaei TaxID=3070815 RepID=A0AA51RWT3_9GAMM|nr:hypothetical protein [Pleionea sp. HL-JVS1]WMS88904.1 hypothetical protein Q9312_08305 [Pleionea sp. HL-JVS1]